MAGAQGWEAGAPDQGPEEEGAGSWLAGVWGVYFHKAGAEQNREVRWDFLSRPSEKSQLQGPGIWKPSAKPLVGINLWEWSK